MKSDDYVPLSIITIGIIIFIGVIFYFVYEVRPQRIDVCKAHGMGYIEIGRGGYGCINKEGQIFSFEK